MKYIYNGYATKTEVEKAIEAYKKAGNPEPLKRLIAIVGESKVGSSVVKKIKEGKDLTFQEYLEMELNLTGRKI